MGHPECLVFFFFFVVAGAAAPSVAGDAKLSRSSFPPGFLFGTASSAYQYEGAAAEGGRGPSIWDTFTNQHPEKIKDRSSGNIATDFYHRYKEDVNIMKDLGMDAFRFSISWSRILPSKRLNLFKVMLVHVGADGSLRGGINKEGIAYYNNIVDELVSKGLQPFVTLFHWDSPQGLEDLYGGFLSPNIVKDYVDYAELCFREFGDRVKHWITFNEPWTFCSRSYASGAFAPGRCSSRGVGKCSAGDSGREPYTVCHHQLLAHAATVELYRNKYKEAQKGVIGITIVSHWFVPFKKSKSDFEAAERALDFMYGWLMDPLTQGDYPFSMRATLGDRLPKFTEQQSKLIKGSFDFLGLNYYTTHYAVPLPFTSNPHNKSYDTDSFANTPGTFKGKAIGPRAASEWLYIYPPGIRQLLLYTKNKYNNPVIYITENGVDEADNASLILKDALKDDVRTNYYQQHLQQVGQAIREGVDVRGYFAWSLLDNFEWADGYTVRFGIYYVDFRHGLKRYPKSSAHWFRKFLKG
ncbi:hypothetical protein Taro_001467 [Colocasia esculenta]|uniref:Uncharacterized protein n=1 Tax=Colocasia esculenta TaxID=4460 RepID=A0A843TEP8_COLES|nr:hypothetical protein [Colocasia esculenta]